MKGYKLSDETRSKMSVSKLGNKNALGTVPSAETRTRISAALTGRKRSAETCEKISAANRGRRASAETKAKLRAIMTPELRAKISHKVSTTTNDPLWKEQHRIKILAGFTKQVRERLAEKAAQRVVSWGKPTNLEFALDLLLQDAGFEYEAQKRFGKYVVDAYVQSHNLVFEADCSFWYHHQDKEREARRDAYLIERGVNAVIHLDEKDLTQYRYVYDENNVRKIRNE